MINFIMLQQEQRVTIKKAVAPPKLQFLNVPVQKSSLNSLMYSFGASKI